MLAAIFGHIKKIRSEAPSDSEFDSVVKKMVGSFPLEIETADQIAWRLREALVYDLPPDYWRAYRDQLAAVQAGDVKDVSRKYIHPIPHVVVVGRARGGGLYVASAQGDPDRVVGQLMRAVQQLAGMRLEHRAEDAAGETDPAA